MNSKSRIGQRVRIKPEGGMREFYNRTGRIVSLEMGMYRVRLDEPVEIAYVGWVHDDLWEPRLLKRIA